MSVRLVISQFAFWTNATLRSYARHSSLPSFSISRKSLNIGPWFDVAPARLLASIILQQTPLLSSYHIFFDSSSFFAVDGTPMLFFPSHTSFHPSIYIYPYFITVSTRGGCGV
ncbi:hypothetical protein GALMADRAFT_621147 [Galerina marginata CBS 339.88]|uniref:Uncharacterized protein n=1 Tax=Galerina marginata (strain CBS 339.88) TaxID=685588 RepID=A0A067SRT2_GALM3|nr:hypothetical protein GALMADRAFT_621147 [Galerina marginata CBS 339.88]